MPRLLNRVVTCAVITGIWLGTVMGQMAPSTGVSGSVADVSGAVVPNAAVELTNAGTNWSHKTITDAQGRFIFTLVPPGIYGVRISADGFAPLKQEGIRLDSDVPVSLHLTLSVATAATSVTCSTEPGNRTWVA